MNINKYHAAYPLDCSRGAPMGRYGDPVEAFPIGARCRLQALRLDSGGYDRGGAYWGLDAGFGHVYCLFTDDQEAGLLEHYVRRLDRKALVEELRRLGLKAR